MTITYLCVKIRNASPEHIAHGSSSSSGTRHEELILMEISRKLTPGPGTAPHHTTSSTCASKNGFLTLIPLLGRPAARLSRGGIIYSIHTIYTIYSIYTAGFCSPTSSLRWLFIFMKTGTDQHQLQI